MAQGEAKNARSGFDLDGLPSAGGSTTQPPNTIDLEFEWYQLCHGCGRRKWFSALICNECREKHDV